MESGTFALATGLRNMLSARATMFMLSLDASKASARNAKDRALRAFPTFLTRSNFPFIHAQLRLRSH